MAKDVIITAEGIRKWRKRKRLAVITLLILLLILIIVYILLQINYSEGSFSVSLKDNETLESGMAVYESLNDPTGKRKLYAKDIQFMDNISIKWLPDDIDDVKYEGSHNGENYIAYSFYIENQGKDIMNYWYSLYLDDVIKNVDEAIRVIIYVNGEETVYAKANPMNGEAEKDTKKWRTDKDGTIILEQRKDFTPGDLDHITVVVFIEGDDPECTNALLGGMLKMHMEIKEEHIKLED